MITDREKLFITYYLSRCTFLGIGYSLIFNKSKQDAWLCAILGSTLGLIIIKIIQKILNKKEGYTLKEYINKIKYNKILKIIIIFFSIAFSLIILSIINNFISSFFLLNTPPFFITILFLVISYIFTIRGIKNITKTSEVLFFPNIFAIILVIICLFKDISINNIIPIFNTNLTKFIQSSLIFCIYSTAPYIFLLNIKNNGQNLDKFYIVNTILIFLVIIITLLVLGKKLITIYRFPEYMVLKRIKISSFIEKVENIISWVLITDETLSLALATYTIYDFINKNKIIFITILSGIFIAESFIIANNYTITLFVYYCSIYILTASIIILLFLIIAKKKMD